MSKDVIIDKYARLYEIPNQLSLLGHDVESFCLSYQSHKSGDWDESNEIKKLKWHSKSYVGFHKVAIWSYPFYLFNLLAKNKPDIIVAASDMPHIIMGGWLAKKLGIPFVADLYDNFEAYGQAKIPFLRASFYKALSTAQLISTTSESLAEKIRKEQPNALQVISMPSVINKEIFKPTDKYKARQLLNLPLNKPLVGTAGGLTRMKGIDDLFNAWEVLKREDDQIHLVLAGPTELSTPLPYGERVIYLGLISHEDVSNLFNALDVGILCIPDDEFGRYCFPQKAYEMLACNLSIISSGVGDMKLLLNDTPEHLYEVGNARCLADKIKVQTKNGHKQNIPIFDWADSLAIFNQNLKKII